MIKVQKFICLGRGGSLNSNDNDQTKNQIHDEIDSRTTDDETSSVSQANAIKRHSLRSTSSFCDEVFLEELTAVGLIMTTSGAGTAEEDAISCGAVSLNSIVNGGSTHTGASSVTSTNSIVEFNEGKF